MTIPPQLVDDYLKRRWIDLDYCKNALMQKDYPSLKQVGHRLKGNGAMFGFPEISSIGKDLEREATLEDQERVQSIIELYEVTLSDIVSNRNS
jgi:HPt (histidine-containing phosphotransfer) domain-containing protein